MSDGENDRCVDKRPSIIFSLRTRVKRFLRITRLYVEQIEEESLPSLLLIPRLFKRTLYTFQCHGNGMADVTPRSESEWRETHHVFTRKIFVFLTPHTPRNDIDRSGSISDTPTPHNAPSIFLDIGSEIYMFRVFGCVRRSLAGSPSITKDGGFVRSLHNSK